MFLSVLISSIFQVVLLGLLPLVWWLCTARKKEGFFSWLGFKKPVLTGKLWTAIVITVVALGVYAFTMILTTVTLPEGITTAGSQFAGMGLKGIPLIFIYAFVQTSLSEEMFFRGFLLKRITNKFGFACGNIVQALLFGLLHGVPFAIATGNVYALILCTLLPGAFGWFEGWLNEKRYSGSIIPSWLIHGITNFIVSFITL